ncbi:von Willebrand factor type A domain-containing protein [Nocardioides sp. TF02-7]|uniref:vWA domain-containing protein n=1 Tax=Nocardioides sp. TF02-7 TaxID=2917724 RepID=UPI001F055BAF|nr:von Willebrand factor type A domain-containing protein [Nocardioides sp. TF02-7]UMG94073.1 von Willebrand factor type A domain-containing protein [Nocardioides sp. TF02-7]
MPPAPPAPDEDNTFRDHGASGFVDAARDPRSTFALDVDTGSLGVARTLLRDGHRVPPASVRVEEWVNGFEYGDPFPADGDLGLSAETADAPSLDDGTRLVRVGVTAREVTADERPRTNVTLVVDRSGSMDIRERLGLVQASLAVLADRLDPDDTVAVVSFDDRGELLLPPTEVRDQDAIIGAIEELQPRRRHQPGGGAAARLPAGPEGLRPGGGQRRGPRLRRRRQHRPHRPGVDHRHHRRGGSRRHPPGHGGLRHGQLQRPPDGAARRPRRRVLRLCRHVPGGLLAVRHRAGHDADPGGRGRPGAGPVRPRPRDVVPAGRLRQPCPGRRRLHRRGRRRRRAGRRSPGDRALRGAAGQRRGAGHGDRRGGGAVDPGRHRRGSAAARRSGWWSWSREPRTPRGRPTCGWRPPSPTSRSC